LRSDADERAGAQATLTALRVALGPVIFGHTHQRLDGEEVGPWRLYNAGSWMYDPVQIACDGARSRPGAVAVIFNGQVRLLDLLSDLGGEELADMSTGAS
jgi:hypothetical protein